MYVVFSREGSRITVTRWEWEAREISRRIPGRYYRFVGTSLNPLVWFNLS